MPVTVTLGPGLDLTMEDVVAVRLLEQLRTVVNDDVAAGVVLDDDHPLWERHSGGAGHAGREWNAQDEALAEAFYARVSGKARLFLDLLLDRPGRQLTVDEIIATSGGAFTSSFSVAGAINGLRLPHEASERRYPFCWWEGSPSRYAVKGSVAALFNTARVKATS